MVWMTARCRGPCQVATRRQLRGLNQPTGVMEDSNKLDRLYTRTNSLLRDSGGANFIERVIFLGNESRGRIDRSAAATLLALIFSAGRDVQQYAASHAPLVAVLCELAVRFVPQWQAQQRDAIGLAALTMNPSMAALQSKLALQAGTPDPDQRSQYEDHAQASVQTLRGLDVSDDH